MIENNKKKLVNQLNDKVKISNRFIGEVLLPRDDVNKILLNEFNNVLIEYQKTRKIEILKKLREIDSRPSLEGADTDFTTGMSLPLDGEYTALGQLIIDIEELVSKIEKI